MKILLLLMVLVAASSAQQSPFQQAYSRRNRKFSAKIYQETTKLRSDDFCVLPFPLEAILALIGIGAKGDTAKEIFRAVSFTQDPKQVEGIYRKMVTAFRDNKTYLYNLDNVNKVYFQKSFPVLKEFNQTAFGAFASAVENADFEEDTLHSLQEINKWVTLNTRQQIYDTVGKEDITSDSRLVLVNALSVSAFWEIPFHAAKTALFFFDNMDCVDDEMMSITHTFKYYECSVLNAKFAEMYFEGGDMSMTIVVPNERDGLAALELRADEVFEEKDFTYEWVNLRMPTIGIETTAYMNPILKSLGIKKAFNSEEADFSGINGERNLYVTNVIQKTYIDINEFGIRKEATTVVEPVLKTDIPFSYSRLKTVHANCPFLYFFKKDDIIFLVGRYQGP